MNRHLMGYRPDSRDPRDYPAAQLFKMSRAPANADLSAWRPDIEDQLSEGSCVTFGIGGGVRTVVRRDAPQFDFVWNHQQFYNGARQLAGTFDQDSGLDIRTAAKYLQTVGVGHDDLWPYDVANLFAPIPQAVLDDAFQYKALKYHNVAVGAENIKLGIASGFPVIMGLALYESWYDSSVERTGMISMPEQGEKVIGYHCMRADAYNTKFEGYAEVPNQYNVYWGDRGVAHFPLDYFNSSARMIFAIIIDVFGSEAQYRAGTAIGQDPPR